MNRTQAKIEEARFFLVELERTYYEYIENPEKLSTGSFEPPVCQYYLSAFISSARSVMWIMRSEFQNVEGWEEWYQSKRPTGEDEELLKKINAIRVRSEKKEPLKLSYTVEIDDSPDKATNREADESLPEWRSRRYGMKVVRVYKDGEPIGEPQTIEFLAAITSFFWSIEEFPNVDILAVCKSYFSLLETVVAECNGRFHLADEA